MKHVKALTRFRRDMKRMRKRGADRKKLENIVDILIAGKLLPASARPHKLSGEWGEHWECHVAHDWLLIFYVTEEVVFLARTGSHADLFE